MSSATVTTQTKPAVKKKRPLRHRFRNIWRVAFLVALVPFFQPGLIPYVSKTIVEFVSGMLVLIPLATFIEIVTEDLIERLGQLVGGLLHAFFGNVAFFVITITTLFLAANNPSQKAELVQVVQSSIAGTIIIDILFILGISIFIGGMRNGRMQFSQEYSNQYSEMLLVAVIALALPSLAYTLKVSVGLNTTSFQIDPTEAATLSDITAVILIIAYVGYLGWTIFHFRDKAARPQNPEETSEALRGDLIGPLAEAVAPIEEEQQREQLQAMQTLKRDEAAETLATTAATTTPTSPRDPSAVRAIVNERIAREAAEKQIKGKKTHAEEIAADERRGIALWELALLVMGTAGVVFISDHMAESIDRGLTAGHGIGLSPFFIGFIIVPIASNLVELSASISTAWHDRMETCLAVTAGSAIQVALLVAPALVLVGHLIGLEDMNLIFGLFVLAIFGLIAYLFQIVTVDGETTWLEGLQFTSFFAVIAVVAFFAQ